MAQLIDRSQDHMKRAKTRLMVLVPTMTAGGMEHCTSLLLEHFSRDYFDLELVTIFDRPPFFAIPADVRLHVLETMPRETVTRLHIQLSGFTTIRHSDAMFWLENVAAKLARLVTEMQPDVILAQDFYATIIALIAKKSTRTAPKIVGTVHILCSVFLQQIDLGDFYAQLLRQCLQDADAVVAVGKSVANDLIMNFGVRQNQTRVIFNPFDFEEVERLSRENLTAEKPLHDQIPTVLFVGRLAPQKGLVYLLPAIALARKLQEFRCLIVGDGEQRDELKATAERLGISSNVLFLGRVENAFKYMRAATLFVLPSVVEGVPYVLLEAMTSGCAVVATESTDDVKELLGDGQRGVLVPLWDSYALAEAILRILWDKRLRANLIEAGIHYARNFSISSSVTLYEELLKSVL